MDYNETQNMQQNVPQDLEPPLGLGEWLLTLIVVAIPLVGFIMLLVWGFGTGNKSRRNFCRATLILAIVGVVLSMVMFASIANMVASIMSSASL